MCGLAGEAVAYDRMNKREDVVSRLPVIKIHEEQLLHDNFLKGEFDRLVAKYAKNDKKK